MDLNWKTRIVLPVVVESKHRHSIIHQKFTGPIPVETFPNPKPKCPSTQKQVPTLAFQLPVRTLNPDSSHPEKTLPSHPFPVPHVKLDGAWQSILAGSRPTSSKTRRGSIWSVERRKHLECGEDMMDQRTFNIGGQDTRMMAKCERVVVCYCMSCWENENSRELKFINRFVFW